VVNVQQATESIAKWASNLNFFPDDPDSRTTIVQTVCEMANDNEQIDWLVKRVISIYSNWPGLREVRACFCHRFKPCDGIEAFSSVYLDGGFPPDPQNPQLPPPSYPALPPGHAVTADDQIDTAIQALAKAKAMPAPLSQQNRFAKRLAEFLEPPQDRKPLGPFITPERRAEIQTMFDSLPPKQQEGS
jgi:hypothetical protein